MPHPALLRWAAAAASSACMLLGGAAFAQHAPDLVAHDTLRVCADPGFLPFSNDRLEGFENRIAEVIAGALGLKVSYTWYPETSGFLRNTLFAGKCDVVMGINSGGGEAATTPWYYRSGYMIVTRAADGITATSLGDPALAALRFGVIASTPPSDLLLAHDLLPQTTSYALVVDTRTSSPPMDMLRDVAEGRIDAGLVWGPFAGWAIKQGLKLHAEFLASEPGHPRMDYAIAMGLRPGEKTWASSLSSAQKAHAPEIAQILKDAGMPLLDAMSRPLFIPSPPPPVPEPAGFRLDHYRAPTPDTLQGGAIIDTVGVQALVQRGGAVLVDVLPAPRQPPDMKPGTPWLPLREDIAGSVWLPGAGQGVLTPSMEAWFRTRLHDLSGGDMDRPMVFYCLEECWMSWNAAKRATRYGYRHVLWYRGGTDAWSRAGLKLARASAELPAE